MLSVAVYNHYKRIFNESSSPKWLVLLFFTDLYVFFKLCGLIVYVCANWFLHVLTIWIVRPAGDSDDNVKADAVEDDRVELEKSNILLMGPTGSGKSVFAFYLSV